MRFKILSLVAVVALVAACATPTTESGSGAGDGTYTGPGSQADLVDINTADVDTLSTLPGIGQTLAQRIIDYRDTYGPFYYIEDIMNVSGIGASTFENIMDLIMTGFE